MKTVMYTPRGRKGTLTTMIGNGIVTLTPGLNYMDDRVFDRLSKNCKIEFTGGILKEQVKKVSKTAKKVIQAPEKKVAKSSKKKVAKVAAKKTKAN